MVEMPRPKNSFIALMLSLLFPGLGQFYLGDRAKSVGILSISAGILVSIIAFRSFTTVILMGILYLAVMIPAASDAYQIANGHPLSFRSDAVWYVIIMLFSVGPFALPLLWQSPRFSRPAKIICTVLVIIIAVISIMVVAMLGPLVDQILGSRSTMLS